MMSMSVFLADAQTTPDGEAQVIGPLLLQPHMTCVVVRQFDDERPLVLGGRRSILNNQPLLTVDIDRSEQLVLVNGLQEIFVLVFALFFGV